MKPCDAIIIGAGPAGTSTALFLQQRGYRVLLLDQAKFPRDKVCGEFISPAADSLLEELGVLEAIEASEPVRLQGVSISAYEKNELRVDYPPHPGSTRRMTSLSLPRTLLDRILVDRARGAGADLRERHRVNGFILEDGAVTGVHGTDGGGTPFEFHARAVVDAGGRNAVSIRRFNLKIPQRGDGKIALAAHWGNVHLPRGHCYMHVSRPGYTGIAPVGKGRVNVVLVVGRHLLKGMDPQEFYLTAVLKNSLRREMLEGGRLLEKPRAVDSLAFGVKPVPCGGLLLAGDAMGFIDPFTGEGIYLALRSAKIAAGVIDRAFREGGRFTQKHLAVYEEKRYREFKNKFRLSRILQYLIHRPSLCNKVVEILAGHPVLAQSLAGAIGDYLPAGKVVSLKFLAQLMLAGMTGSLSPQGQPGNATENGPQAVLMK